MVEVPGTEQVLPALQRNNSTLRNSAREVTVNAKAKDPQRRSVVYVGGALLLFVAGVFAVQFPWRSAPLHPPRM